MLHNQDKGVYQLLIIAAAKASWRKTLITQKNIENI